MSQLRNAFRTICSAAMASSTLPLRAKQKLEYLLVLDFEATCDNGDAQPNPQEIIEFPCLKLNTSNWTVENVFHRYVRPIEHPTLSSFCTDLTGIVQRMVDDQPCLDVVLEEFDSWLTDQNLPADQWAFATCGDWDLKSALPRQCQFFGYKLPEYFRRWVNVKKPFFGATKIWPKGMMHMLDVLQLKHEGRHHSGIDDAKNIANVIVTLAEKGVVYDFTRK